MTCKDTGLVGREAEQSRLSELVAPPYVESRVLLVLGDLGMGKTVLLAEAAREARLAGMRVLAAAGWESEQDLAFAGLHQLLRPVLDRVASLPARQAGALRGAFVLSEDPVPHLAPVPLLPQARHSQPPPAPRPHRPRRNRPAVGSAPPEAVPFWRRLQSGCGYHRAEPAARLGLKACGEELDWLDCCSGQVICADALIMTSPFTGSIPSATRSSSPSPSP